MIYNCDANILMSAMLIYECIPIILITIALATYPISPRHSYDWYAFVYLHRIEWYQICSCPNPYFPVISEI
jgi:hypothetical protein